MDSKLGSSPRRRGEEFQIAVANLLRRKYKLVLESYVESGKQVDIYFETVELQQRLRWYVEVKSFERRISVQDITNIYAYFSGILRQNAPAQLMVVTLAGVSRDAQEFIHQHAEIVHFTIDQLKAELFGSNDEVEGIDDQRVTDEASFRDTQPSNRGRESERRRDRISRQIMASSEVAADIIDGKLTVTEGPAGLVLIGDEVDFADHLETQRRSSQMVAEDCAGAQMPHDTVRLFQRYAAAMAEEKVLWYLADDLMNVIRSAAVEPGWPAHSASYLSALSARHAELRAFLERKKVTVDPPVFAAPITPEIQIEFSTKIDDMLADPEARDGISDGSALFLGHIASKVKSADAKQANSAIRAISGFVLSAYKKLNKFGRENRGTIAIGSFIATLVGVVWKIFGGA